MIRRHWRLWSMVPCAIAAFAAACGGDQPAPRSNTPPPGAVRVDEAQAGTINGRILFEGTPPENPTIRMGSDPVCARENPGTITFQTVSVTNGGLDNVFVYVKDGLGNYYVETPAEPVRLDQHGCRYEPHVLGVRVGQPIEISNSDETMHNVHALGKANRGFNFPQPIKGMKSRQTFPTPEVMVTVKCDVHPWMNAYIGVVNHPYFAVSANGGTFDLKNVPAGTYTIEAWHEKLGTQTQSVTLGAKETKPVSFTFKAGSATN